MKIIDAYILASTKRKTRRIRTSLVIIVSSLLFAVLFFAAFAGKGLLDSAQQVKDVGFNGRNMVSIGQTAGPTFDFKAEMDKIKTNMDGELRDRGIKVTDNTRLDSGYVAEYSRRLQALGTQASKDSQARLEAQVHSLGKPTAVYHFSQLDVGSQVAYQADINTDLYVAQLEQQELTGGIKQQSYDPYADFQFFSGESDMFRTQLQPGQNFSWQPGQPYPMVISYAYLEKLSGQSFAKVDASARNKAYRSLMQTYAGKTLDYCYRNATAQTQLQGVISYNHKAANDTDSSTNPVDVPHCANFDQKVLKKIGVVADADPDAPKPLFPAQPTPDPTSREIQFKIVGYVPSQAPFGGGDIVSQILTSVSTLPASPEMGVVPSEVVAKDALLQGDPANAGYFAGYASIFADFATRADQKAFIAAGCSGNQCGNPKNTRPYVQAFGSISFALQGLFHSAAKFVLIGAGGIMVIAALLMMFTISKVIADSTKEIAVFRSLGARRRDIAQIYYTYGLMLAAMALLLSVALAVVGAEVVTAHYNARIANAFVQTVGAYNTDVHATLLGVQWLWFGGVVVALAVAAFLGITVPVIASLRRKLITILREE